VKIFGYKGEEMTGRWKKLYNEVRKGKIVPLLN
jgi:hypothetical protein